MLSHVVDHSSGLAFFKDRVDLLAGKRFRRPCPEPLLFSASYFFWPIWILHYDQFGVPFNSTLGPRRNPRNGADSVCMNQSQMSGEVSDHFLDVRDDGPAAVRVIDREKNPLKWEHSFASFVCLR